MLYYEIKTLENQYYYKRHVELGNRNIGKSGLLETKRSAVVRSLQSAERDEARA